MHTKDRPSSSLTLYENDHGKHSLTPEEGSIDDDYAEKESILSINSDIFDITDDGSPSSFLEFSPNCEETLVSTSASTDAADAEETNLPSKYKNIISSFVSTLREKLTFNDIRNE